MTTDTRTRPARPPSHIPQPMSASRAQPFPRNSRVCAVLLLTYLPSLSSETPIANSSSRLRGTVVQVTPAHTLVIPADADGCAPCDPLSSFSIPVCLCNAGDTLCGLVEAACDDSNSKASSSTHNDSSLVGDLDSAMQLQGADAINPILVLPTEMVNGKQSEYGAGESTRSRICYKRSCVQFKCSHDRQVQATQPPSFCPLLVSTWVGPSSPFVNMIPADPFCGPGAYLQCTDAPHEPFQPDPIMDATMDMVFHTRVYVYGQVDWFWKTHPLWAIVSSPLLFLALIFGGFIEFIFITCAVIFSFFFPTLRRAGLEFIEDMPFIAIAITFVISIMAAARWARARHRKFTSPRAD